VAYEDIAARRPFEAPAFDHALVGELECRVKYRGYIERQEREIARTRELEELRLPAGIDYSTLPTLSSEVREKLMRVRPQTLGQAARIPGVTPVAVSILAVHVKRERDRPCPIADAAPR